ncbi:hypothetical protein MHU86_11538 [Fragilaria crotonensis]|nr:hypothetical protein MHU86_11538 [Fragilaria crotonensis]
MEEWYELMPHMARNRRVFLLADVSGHPANEEKIMPMPAKSRGKSLLVVKVKVGGEIVSFPDEAHFEGIADGGIMEYLPRNEDGCQHELISRYETGIPYVSGSSSAHECCAISAHNARKERVVTEHKAKKQVALNAMRGSCVGELFRLVETEMDAHFGNSTLTARCLSATATTPNLASL